VFRGLTCLLGSCSDGGVIGWVRGVLGSMETGGLGCQFSKTSFLVLVKMQLEVGPGVIGFVFVGPSFDGMGIDSSFAKGKKRQLDGGSVRDWFAALGGDGAHDFDIFPKIFHRVVRLPCFGELVAIGFKVGGSERTVCGSQVCDDGRNEDVGVSKGVVFEVLIVDRIDSGKNLLFEFFLDVRVRFELVEIMVVCAVGGCNLSCGGSGCMDRLGTWMVGSIECCASANEVGGGRHDNAEMAVNATSAIGV